VNSDYFNPNPDTGVKCEEVQCFDFAGTWYITAIATEAGHSLKASWPEVTPTVEFDTDDCSNWGLFEEINFYTGNLVFEDFGMEEEYKNFLDPFCCCEDEEDGDNCDQFKVCRLTQDSELLAYLPNPTTLRAGDYIIGWNNGGTDSDYDDIFIAARPVVCVDREFRIVANTLSEDWRGYTWCNYYGDPEDSCPTMTWAWPIGTDGLECQDAPTDPDTYNDYKTDVENIDTIEHQPSGQDGKKAVFYGSPNELCPEVYMVFEDLGEGNRACIVRNGKKYCAR
jgi:hypothetical protein